MGEPGRADGIYDTVMGLGLGSSTLHREQEDTFTRACVIFQCCMQTGRYFWVDSSSPDELIIFYSRTERIRCAV